MNDGNSIATAARSWLGTRFHHQGRLKKTLSHHGGVDCLGLLIGVASELRLQAINGQQFSAYDKTDYTHYPDTKALYAILSQLMHTVSKDELAEGDILLLDVDNNPQHLAIVSELSGQWGIIHAYAPARAVVEHPLDTYWVSRITAVFRL